MTFLFFISSWLPVGIWAGFIYYLSSIPSLNSGLGVWDFVLRKIAHVVEFAALAFLLIRAMVRTWPMRSRNWLIRIAAGISVLYAISDEVHQSFVPGRGPSVRDVVIDSVGVALAVIIYRRKCRHCEPEGRSNLSTFKS